MISVPVPVISLSLMTLPIRNQTFLVSSAKSLSMIGRRMHSFLFYRQVHLSGISQNAGLSVSSKFSTK